ncbi:MAG: iron-containing alcohol dehydrogenase [Alcaligenes faecalis]|jgi:alcohol dehydrogenase class IV|uniref:Iron-containing alcohol dehydrogenase n=1 Tax=Alcaligenes aquatilis TaxID=323284 RepID=A0A3G2HUL8_9BURK|nr:iron-containing alcohol dehydrogenase [Alcaligenes aquatilis]AYN20428.1 iron-containing alcohol dehydrogenase [Alcaligenes aquatilis]MCH4223953.1 iron-containing alcohol dehydrogenase [Alcaligenes faecalis]
MSLISLPGSLLIGGGVLEQLPDLLRSMHCQKALLITDPTMVSLGHPQRVQTLLAQHNIHCDIFSETVPEPTAASIQAGVVQASSDTYDVLIALGGGSPIDSAKAISVLSRHGGTIRDYAVPAHVTRKGLALIAIPTTAGTGSEFTRFTIITDEQNDEKLLCTGPAFVPDAALIDYELTLTVPPRTTADTGIDAMTHAIEAYVSRKANAYSDSQALAAMNLIGPNLERVYQDGQNRPAREAMMLGASLAGVAFSAASVALVHGMSRPIGAFFHVPHGLSNAILLPTVTAFSIPAAPERYAQCARALGFAVPEDNDTLANQKLLSTLHQLNQNLQVPSLRALGIEQSHFDSLRPTMAQQALASGSPNNNPRLASQEEIEALYAQLWT